MIASADRTDIVLNLLSGLFAVALGASLALQAWPWAAAALLSWSASTWAARTHSGSATKGRTTKSNPHDDSTLSIAEFRAVTDSIPALIAVLNSDLHFEYANRGHERIHGKKGQGVNGAHLRESLTETAYAEIEPYVMRALAGERVQFEIAIPSEINGHPLHFDTTYVPRLRKDGTVSGFYSLSAHVTGKKLAEYRKREDERSMLRSQKLESLGVLAGGIAHDFNNLLVSMLANVGIIRHDTEDGQPIDEELRQIESAANSAADLCRQMLDYAGQGSAEFDSVDLARLTYEMADLLEVSFPPSVSLQFDLQSPMPSVDGDASQLRQVIMNLITNAVEAMIETGGYVTIRSGEVDADANTLAKAYVDDDLAAGQYAFLEITDSGCGMNENVLSNIFDPFFSTKFTGRGLGLASVLGIVRAHRGAIEVNSEPGVGTTFRLLFPVVETPTKHAPVDSAEPIDQWKGNGTVLVVDDDPGLRKATRRILTSCGLDPLMAESGADALKILAETEPGGIDIIVLDLTMPEMDGAETLAEIRKVDSRVPILLCSGYSQEEVHERCKGLDYSGMLVKPFGFESYARAIRALLES